MAASAKLLAEAACEEIKIILGWVFDFGRLLVTLPENKSAAWSEAIREMIQHEVTAAKVLETNIGRLVHLGMILPAVHHFMSRLRELHARANRRSIKITKTCLDDLHFLMVFRAGISLNQIAYRKPTRPRGL